MVEQVARGRLRVAAAAALGLATVGVAAPALAESRSATLQIRVRVVEACQIRVDNRLGRPLQICGTPRGVPPMPEMPEMPSMPPMPPAPNVTFDPPAAWPAPPSDPSRAPSGRVRFVTFTW